MVFVDVGVYILFGGELFVEVELARHLEDVLSMVVLGFSGFIECHKGAVDARCQSSAEGRSVGEWVVRDGLLVSLLVPYEHQHLIVGIRLCSPWDRIIDPLPPAPNDGAIGGILSNQACTCCLES